MPNPKRQRIIKSRQSIVNLRLRSKMKLGLQHFTLGEIEDSNDKVFLVEIASRAAANAINENKAMNIPMTLMKDGWVVRMDPDGEIIKLKEIENIKRVYKILKKGDTLHVKGTL